MFKELYGDIRGMKFINLSLTTLILVFSISSWAQFRPWIPPQYVEKSKTENEFSVPAPLSDEVQFWIKIYTQYTTKQGVFHMSGDLTKILGEIDLNEIYEKKEWGPIRKEKEAELYANNQKKLLAKKLNIKNYKTIRLQMGLKDRMQTAIVESGKYLPMMEKIFKEHGLPPELTRIVFVESSFNVKAQSKVGASGLWQIMPNIGKKFKYIKKSFDKRNHPEFATYGAAKILQQNYQILKSWPLAVTSYNFGVGSMLKVRKKMKSTDATEIFGSEDLKKHIGFASRNFYATFLAALYVESHANLYFGEPLLIGQEILYNNIVISKKISVQDFLEKNKISKEVFKEYNPHIFSKYMKSNTALPEGTLVSIPHQKEKSKTALAEEG